MKEYHTPIDKSTTEGYTLPCPGSEGYPGDCRTPVSDCQIFLGDMFEFHCQNFVCPLRISCNKLFQIKSFTNKATYSLSGIHFRSCQKTYKSICRSQKDQLFRNWNGPTNFTAARLFTKRSIDNCKHDSSNHKNPYKIPGDADKVEPFWEQKQQHLLKDFRETSAKVKEKVDEIIERENIYTVPNFLCVGRILISPLLCYAVGQSYYSLSLGLFIFAGFTDLIDGMIARSFSGQATRLGSFLDPLADKVLIASCFLSLTYVGLIPIPLAGLIIYRDFIIIVAASYIRYKSVSPPITLSRYFDATHVTAQLSPTLISKFNTGVQLCLIAASLAAPVFDFSDHYLLHTFGWFTAGTTFASGISYIFSSDTYKILSSSNLK